MLIKFFLGVLLFYFVFKLIRNFFNYFLSSSGSVKSERVKNSSEKKYEIKKEDIIEADFEEIKPEKSDEK